MFDVFSSLPVFLFKIKEYVKYCIIWINKRSAVYYFCGVISFYMSDKISKRKKLF